MHYDFDDDDDELGAESVLRICAACMLARMTTQSISEMVDKTGCSIICLVSSIVLCSQCEET